MIRHLLVAALAGLSLLPAPASSAQSTPSAPTAPDCMGGRVLGQWNLPTGREPGHVRGLLAGMGERKFVLEARLAPGALPDGTRGGQLDGYLSFLSADGVVLRPLAEVHGFYRTDANGEGRFEARILRPSTDRSRPELTGRMEGLFRDPPSSGDDTPGRFAGRWTICR